MTDDNFKNESDFSFTVQKINWKSWVLYFVLFGLLYGGAIYNYFTFGMYVDGFLLGLASIFFLVFIWRYLTTEIALLYIIEAVQLSSTKRFFFYKMFYKTVGIYLEPKNENFLSAKGGNLNLNKPWSIFSEKILKMLGLIAGINMITMRLLAFATDTELDFLQLWDTINFFNVFSAVISSLFILWIFIVDDIGINGIDPKGNVETMQENAKGGYLGKFIGIGGLVLIFDFTVSIYQNAGEDSITSYIFGFIDALEIYSYQVLIPFWVTLIYFNFFHETIINNIRQTLSEIIPVKHLVVNSVTDKLHNKITTNPEEEGKTLKKRSAWNLAKESSTLLNSFENTMNPKQTRKRLKIVKIGLRFIQLALLPLSFYIGWSIFIL
jgi:hypothetical protein